MLPSFTLSDPELGLNFNGSSSLEQSLAIDGLQSNASIGESSAPIQITGLGGASVWATLVPIFSGTAIVNATVAGPVTGISNQSLAPGSFLYITAQKPAQQAGAAISGFQSVATSPHGEALYGLSPQIAAATPYNLLVVANASDATQRQTFSLPVERQWNGCQLDHRERLHCRARRAWTFSLPTETARATSNSPTFYPLGDVNPADLIDRRHGRKHRRLLAWPGSRFHLRGRQLQASPKACSLKTTASPFFAATSSPEGSLRPASQSAATAHCSTSRARPQTLFFNANGIASSLAFAGPSGVLATSPSDQYVYLASGNGGTRSRCSSRNSNAALSVLQTPQDGVNDMRGLTGARRESPSRETDNSSMSRAARATRWRSSACNPTWNAARARPGDSRWPWPGRPQLLRGNRLGRR